MKVIEVIPITRFAPGDTLSYFSNKEIIPGSIVKIPLRSKIVSAIAVKVSDTDELKTALRQSSFSLKKISSLQVSGFFSTSFMKASEISADYFATTTGSIIKEMTPAVILDNISHLKQSLSKRNENLKSDGIVFQGTELERISFYKSLIREEFSRKKSVFLCVPSIQDLEKMKQELEKGIENFVFAMHSSLPNKSFIKTWNEASNLDHPVLVIATPAFFCFDRSDISTIIVERENSRLYKDQKRPYVDTRYFAEKLASLSGVRIIFGDTLLRIETIERYQSGELSDNSPLTFRSHSTADQTIVDMRRNVDDTKTKFKIISDQLIHLVNENKEVSGNMFVFSARRGLSPITVCADCGEVVKCSQCSAPTNLHRDDKHRNLSLESDDTAFFLCHHCGQKRSAKERCLKCSSWNLRPLGIGIEKVEEELQKIQADVKIFRIDKDVIKNAKEATKIAKAFYASPGSILLGTEMALPYLSSNVFFSAIASIDALFSIPDFRIRERILAVLLKIRNVTERKFLIQTRNPDEIVMNFAVTGNTADFYRGEIDERREFRYPPFYVLIKISVALPKEQTKAETDKLAELLVDYEFVTFRAFIETVKGKKVTHTLIRVRRDLWPDSKLLSILRTLSPKFRINVDPENLL